VVIYYYFFGKNFKSCKRCCIPSESLRIWVSLLFLHMLKKDMNIDDSTDE